MRRVIKKVLRNQTVTNYLRGVYHEARAEGLGGNLPETDLPEAAPIGCRKSSINTPRLNLLVPALSIQSLFGGISTALALFDSLAAPFGSADLRIILTDQQQFMPEDNRAYSDWQISSLEQEDTGGRLIVPAGDRYGKTLAVRAADRFIATAWWTAVSARAIQNWQQETFSPPVRLRYLYLIQDFEPGFYPWSSRYALAEASYHDTERFIPLFNSSLLQSFFLQSGYRFQSSFCFEPVLHPQLRGQLQQTGNIKKGRRLLVYGRPSVPRNGFELAVMGLRCWVAQGGGAGWEVISVGEQHPPVELGNGLRLVSAGKLTLEQYAAELARAAVGLSLMISPHPSYPPLEMAAFGMQVVSSSYGTKKQGSLHPHILAADPLTPQQIAATIRQAAENAFKSNNAETESTPAWQHYLNGKTGFDELAVELLAVW